MNRRSPLKSGMSSEMVALPAASSATGPENSDTVLVGTTSSARPPISPPVRSVPTVPVLSISRP